MSQPTHAYDPSVSFRPASAWQQQPGPQVRTPRQPSDRSQLATVGVVLAIVGMLLYAAQGVVTVMSAADVDAAAFARILVIWSPSVVLLGLALAIATRSLPLIAVLGALTVLEAVGIAVFGSLGSIAWWESLAIVPTLLAVGAGVVALLGTVTSRQVLVLVGQIAAIAAIVLHTLLVTIGPVASAAVLDAGAFLLSSAPPIVVGILAAIVCAFARSSPAATIAAGIAIVVLALTVLVDPIVGSVRGLPPAIGVVVVVGLRFLLVAVGGALLLVSGTRRR